MAWRWVLALLASTVLVVGTFVVGRPDTTRAAPVPLRNMRWPAAAVSAPAPPRTYGTALILYDDRGEYTPLAHVYATLVGNLASHFATPVIEGVSRYRRGDMHGYRAVVYVGAEASAHASRPLIADTHAGTTPVMWLGDNARDLVAGRWATVYGWKWSDGSSMRYTHVRYAGTTLTRSADDAGPLHSVRITNAHKARTLAVATGTRGSSTPWAIRSGNLIYVAEAPVDAEDATTDRYLALTNLMFDLFRSSATPRHRALLRLEDIGPDQ